MAVISLFIYLTLTIPARIALAAAFFVHYGSFTALGVFQHTCPFDLAVAFNMLSTTAKSTRPGFE